MLPRVGTRTNATVGATPSSTGVLRPAAFARTFDFGETEPDESAAYWVQSIWSVTWAFPPGEQIVSSVVPSPSISLTVERGGGRRDGRQGDGVWVTGVVTRRFDVVTEGVGGVVGIKFRPGGFHPFHPIPAHRLTNAVIPLADVFDGFAPTSFAEIEDGLRAHGWTDDPRLEEVAAVYALMLQDPSITRVDQLCRALGYSRRTLQRLFREYVGVTPKWVLDRIRLHEAAERMADGDNDWPAMALELGFFDQAHFIKAFKAVVGRSPADYALTASASVA